MRGTLGGMWMILALLLQANPSPAPGALVAGKDVAAPRKLAARPAPFPATAREHGIHGFVVLDVIVNEVGQPVDLKVVRGNPFLNEAAIQAVKSWQYEPTVVDGASRRVEVVELIGFYSSPAEKVETNTKLARDAKEPAALRVAAIAELVPAPPKHRKRVVEALTVLAKDPDAAVRTAAARALEQVGP